MEGSIDKKRQNANIAAIIEEIEAVQKRSGMSLAENFGVYKTMKKQKK